MEVAELVEKYDEDGDAQFDLGEFRAMVKDMIHEVPPPLSCLPPANPPPAKSPRSNVEDFRGMVQDVFRDGGPPGVVPSAC